MTTSSGPEELQKRIAAGERDFQGESFSGANLNGADLRGANLRGASLRGANLHGADLREAKLIRADLGMADLGTADLAAAELNAADLRGANLKGAHFDNATLDGAILREADLHGADLRAAQLVRADLSRADLGVADLAEANLGGADLRGTDLSAAKLKNASLRGATLYGADLRDADLTGANLRGANLTDTRLEGAIFTNGRVGGTVFADLDLRQAKGLETLHHGSPSTVGTDTLSRSVGKIPDIFLRGCGLTAWEILAAKEYDPSLSRAEREDLQGQTREARLRAPLQRKRFLLSYSESDASFVEEVRRLLLARDIFSWVAPHETKGPLRERQSKLAIQHNVTLLLVLSQHSVESDWVEHEVRLARRLEKSLGDDVLCLVSVDEAWETSPRKGRIIENGSEEGVLSFADWRDTAALEKQFAKLLDGIAPFYPSEEPTARG